MLACEECKLLCVCTLTPFTASKDFNRIAWTTRTSFSRWTGVRNRLAVVLGGLALKSLQSWEIVLTLHQPVALCFAHESPSFSQLSCYLSFGWRLQGGCGSLVPPGQWGTEPLHLTQVDEEGAIGAVHTVKGVARVWGPTSAHPLEGKDTNGCLSKMWRILQHLLISKLSHLTKYVKKFNYRLV